MAPQNVFFMSSSKQRGLFERVCGVFTVGTGYRSLASLWNNIFIKISSLFSKERHTKDSLASLRYEVWICKIFLICYSFFLQFSSHFLLDNNDRYRVYVVCLQWAQVISFYYKIAFV